MRPLPPILFLAIVAGITAVAWMAHQRLCARRSARLRRLARQWQMHYAEADHFNLARRIAADFPVPGATDLRVVDLIYASDVRQYCYIFTADFTCGAIGRQTRDARIMSFCEPKDVRQPQHIPLKLATPGTPIVEQYEQLKAQTWPGQPDARP